MVFHPKRYGSMMDFQVTSNPPKIATIHTFLSLVFAGWQDILAACDLVCTCDCNAYTDTFVIPPLSFLPYFGGFFLGNVDTFSSLYFNPVFYPLSDFQIVAVD